ncbi:MAG: hypothetical protein R6X20_02325 [Phycisphaerae bacterium]
MNLLENVKVTLVKAQQTSAGTDVESDSVDMEGFEGVVFLAKIATANAANFLKAQQSSDDGSSDAFADLEGTKVVPGDDGDQAKLDIYRPRERYVRAVIDRGGASTATGDIYAVQYGARKAPIANDDAETHVSPAEGTA